MPAATLDPVQIIAAAPHQRVVATTTDQGVVSLIATQPVVATATLQIVVAAVALQHVIAGATQQPITKPTSHQGVVTCQSIDPIHHVAVAAQTVGASRGAAHHHPRLLLLSAPDHPIAEPEALDSQRWKQKMPLHPHLIRRRETQPQVIPQPLQRRHLRTAQVDELHNIAIRH